MAKLSLQDIKGGSLVSQIREVAVEFMLPDGDIGSVDIRIKQLPFVETEALHKRLAEKDKDVVPEWIAKTLVDEDGKPAFTPKQVKDNFIQSLTGAVFDEVIGSNSVKKFMELKEKQEQSQEKANSSTNLP